LIYRFLMGKKMFEGTLGARPRRRAANARANLTSILVGALVCLTPELAQAQSSPKIEWEVYNRFRFYKDPEIFRTYLAAAESAKGGGPGAWVLATEDALQAKSENELRGWAAANFLKQQPFCWSAGSWRYLNCGSERDYILPKTIAILAQVTGDQSRANGTCAWAMEKPDGSKVAISGDCAGAKIDVPYAGDATQASKLCIASKPNGTDCVAGVDAVDVKIRDYLILGMGDSFGAGVGNPDIPAEMEADGRNDLFFYTINGVPWQHDFSGAATERRRYLPVRRGLNGGSGGDGQAQWLDMRCFRSQYGPQFRAALQLASALKHNSVTYVDLACSGATVLQGLLASKPLDLGFRPGLPPVPAQFEDAARIVCDRRMPPWKVTVQFQTQFRPSGCGEGKLCEYQNDKTLDLRALQSATGLTLNQSPTPQEIRLSGCGDDGYRRPIDYILLSIGGNDIGFASLVAQDALLADTLDFDILRHFLQYTLGAIEDRAGAEKRLSFLEHIYTRLNEAFRTLMPMREHDMSRILLTAYPLPDGWKGASLCGDETEDARRADQTMDAINVLGGFMIDGAPDPQKKSIVASVHAAACELDVWRMKWMDEAAGASGSMNDACSGISSGSEPASKLPWGYVTGLVDKVWPHGFCAVRNCSGGHGSLDCAAETAKMPGFESGRIFGHPPPAQTSIPDVGQYRPYHTRERWFRTFNDAYLTTSWQATLTDPSNVANALSTLSTSAMHPTAEGYAAIADSLVQAIGADLCKRGEVDDAGKEIVNFCPH
jgi:lysophospholipase L1-like esterase